MSFEIEEFTSLDMFKSQYMIDCINVHHTLTDVMKNRPIKCGGASFEANMADMEGS